MNKLQALKGKFADFLLKEGKEEIITDKEAGQALYELRKKLEGKSFDPKTVITFTAISNLVCAARAILEEEKGVTVIRLQKRGYKIADEQEATIFGVRQFKRLTTTAIRTRRVQPLIKREYLKSKALAEDLKELGNNLHLLTNSGEKFLIALENLKQETPHAVSKS